MPDARRITRGITVQRWTGREARALRQAKRMSLTAFAENVGVDPRTVSKWEAAGEGLVPHPNNQANLDSMLATSGPDVQERFAAAVGLLERRHSPLIGSGQVRHPLDGKLMARIEEGMYLPGGEYQPVFVATFYLDVFPTTNADYARFTAATGHRAPAHWPSGQCPPVLADHPVVFVSWRDAAAYAAWAGKALPQAVQWEKAARGTGGAAYPWGHAQTPAKCNVRECGIGSTTPVGRYYSGVSPYGVYDLCGNVWEWCESATAPQRRQLKGGAFTSPFEKAAPTVFNGASADMCDDDTGFRCAASLTQMHAARAL